MSVNEKKIKTYIHTIAKSLIKIEFRMKIHYRIELVINRLAVNFFSVCFFLARHYIPGY